MITNSKINNGLFYLSKTSFLLLAVLPLFAFSLNSSNKNRSIYLKPNRSNAAKSAVNEFTIPATVNIAFVPSTTAAPAGYTADNGLAYSDARGFGWVNPTTKAPQDMTANMRIRTGSSAKQLLGVVQMQASDKGQLPGTWEYTIPNGTYRVTIGAGDEAYFDSDHQINAEGLPIITDLITTTAAKHKVAIGVVTVTDGKLTIDATGGINSKINYISIANADPVTDTTVPTASIRLAGSLQSAGVYTGSVQVFGTATDGGAAGIKSLQYSINNAAYVNYTSPITITAPNTYSITLKAIDANNNEKISTASSFTISGGGQATGTTTKTIAFLPSTSTAPAGYTPDNGLAYTDARGFGWVNPITKAPQDMTANMRIRTGTSAKQLLGVVQMQASDKGQLPGTWECAVANGTYRVTIGAGDEGYFDSTHQINAEGLPIIADLTTSTTAKHKIAIGVVTVSDGKLTIDANGGVNSKINYVTIAPASQVTDTTVPTVGLRIAGAISSPGVYSGPVQVFLSGTDDGGAGMDSLKYSINNAAFVNYTTPLTITAAGSYSIVAKAVDANNNKKTSPASAFSIGSGSATGTAGVYMVLKNPDGFPADDRLLFSLIKTPWRRTSPDTTPFNANHDKIKLRINNRGVNKLTVTNLQVSNTTAWKVISVGSDLTAKVPFSVNSEAFVDVTIQFITKDAGTRIKIFTDSLTITSNDSAFPTKRVKLTGISQLAGESTNEPYAQQIITAAGFTSTTGYGHDDGDINGTAKVPNSSEVVASYFIQADPTRPITVHQVAAYHGCCSAIESIRYFKKGSSSSSLIFTHNNLDGQSVLPRLIGSTTLPATNTFNVTGSFGLKVGSASSDRTQNFNGLIGMRILKAMDPKGNIIPNAYFLDCDYLGTQFTNYDYQDNIYYIENIKPDAGSEHYSELVSLPKTAIDLGPVKTASSGSFILTLKNNGQTYPDGSSDSPITLQGLQIVGPNSSEFSVSALTTTNLAVQGTTTLTVKFNPSTVGIKNAALMVKYNSSAGPLRIPLYGIGNSNTATVNVIKRIKGGADANLTSADGTVFESDKSYRSGSIKLDMQVVKGPVACTDNDILYQTYLSAAADLAETRYSIPIANGNYLVRMHFVENYWNAVGSRVFNTYIENNLALPSFDIFSEVGYRSALVKDVAVSVTDGAMTFRFDPTANRLGIAAMEIFQVQNVSSLVAADTTQQLSALRLAPESLSTEKKITVYPNPNVGNSFFVNASNFAKNEKVTILITNMSGRLLQTESFVADALGGASVHVALNNALTKGVYIISAQSSSGNLVSKLMVDGGQ
ncbi:malectin domain-containing carbohydrate-binding protein [Mucilaginibacter aquaedulcis]|uniref:malectin domain-containing carbohydrate-binding protein n=1 Tax=Mucilaginibacter aquaedulcis TaxID=1187081 RepID=UPI0025B44E21|nr:malectin domain-containing carbohydrate-binding protein [Mucilaginibacter aquaedulcis]MDN3550494.1 malectin domain-containing carbohydrate-binding protein [Mucilaginibacter aquaedulcis]